MIKVILFSLIGSLIISCSGQSTSDNRDNFKVVVNEDTWVYNLFNQELWIPVDLNVKTPVYHEDISPEKDVIDSLNLDSLL